VVYERVIDGFFILGLGKLRTALTGISTASDPNAVDSHKVGPSPEPQKILASGGGKSYMVGHDDLTISLVEYSCGFKIGDFFGGVPEVQKHLAVVFAETGGL
jgi:hypothetical protein